MYAPPTKSPAQTIATFAPIFFFSEPSTVEFPSLLTYYGTNIMRSNGGDQDHGMTTKEKNERQKHEVPYREKHVLARTLQWFASVSTVQ